MNRRIVKLLSCFIPSRKLRHKFRDRFSPKCSILKDNGKNNRLIILDDEGNETNSQYIKNLEVIFDGDNNEIKLYQDLNLHTLLRIRCKSGVCISIGKSVNAGLEIPVWLSDNSKLKIGDYCYFVGVKLLMHDESGLTVNIGNDCLFSHDVMIRPSDGHTLLDMETKKILNLPQSIEIGNHCWICHAVKILKGAIIPDNSVVGMSSIYTKGSNPSAATVFDCGGGVFIGSPARLVKSGVTWNCRNTEVYLKEIQNSENK